MFINPTVPVYMRVPSLPLGLISIGSYLEHYGHQVTIYDHSDKEKRLKDEITRFQPDVIGISALSFLCCIDAKRLTAQLRGLTKAPVVWGGQAPSAEPELILREAGPDYLILGEGEVTWLEFAERLQKNEPVEDLEGLAYLNEAGAFVCNPMRPVADLTAFPEFDWTLVDPAKYFSSFFNCTKMLYLHASKGCPAACIFCSNNQYHQGRNRTRDPVHVMHDISYLVEKCGANGIYFSDELFCPRRDVRTQLCNMLIEKNYDLVWGCQMRLGVLNEEDLKLMYRAGCRWILFGIESGSEERIRSIKKRIDISLAEETVRWCKDAGITVQASFIIGFPGETEDEVRQTVALGLRIRANLLIMNVLTPIPNSELFRNWERDYPKHKRPKTIKEYAKKIELNAADLIPWNFSAVPMYELRAIHYYCQWRDFVDRDAVNDERYGVVRKLFRDTLNRIFRHGLQGFFFGTLISARQFLTVFFYSHFFPRVIKKYGMNGPWT